MFTDGKVYKNFRLEDANSLITFERWIRDNTELYSDDTVVKKEHQRIFINYLKEQLDEVKLLNKSEWLGQLEVLSARLEEDE
jgi:hypothetical protein